MMESESMYGSQCESNPVFKESIGILDSYSKPKQAWLNQELMDICSQQASPNQFEMGTKSPDAWSLNGGFMREKLEPEDGINWRPMDWPAPHEQDLALQSIIDINADSKPKAILWKGNKENMPPKGWEHATKEKSLDGDMSCILGVKEEVVYTSLPPKPAQFEVVELLVVNEEPGEESSRMPPETITLQFSSAPNKIIPMLNIPKRVSVDQLVRDGRKGHECRECGRVFKHQYTLARHLPTHTDERNFPCNVCGKAFRQMSTLLQHGAIHSDARPFVCDVCQHSFNRISTLISHRKTHSGAKPHVCQHCGKRFHQKGNLRNHVFTHTNERPYKCEVCAKGFNQKSNLICHRSRYHATDEGYPRKKRAPKPTNVRLIGSDLDLAVLPGTEKGSLVVDALTCGSVRAAIATGDMVFVLYQPLNGAEQMMRLLPVNRDKHMLIPVSVADLKTARPGAAQQFQVTTLATLYEKVAVGGGVEIVESPNTSVCEIKLEPAFQNLCITQIQGWPSNLDLANGLNLPDLAGNVETITSELITMENLQFVDFPGANTSHEESVLS